MNSETVRAKYDWAVKRPSTAVVETVAAATGRKPTDIRSLYGSVDPDALDALLRADFGASGDEPVCLSFPYADRDVTVRSDGYVIAQRRR